MKDYPIIPDGFLPTLSGASVFSCDGFLECSNCGMPKTHLSIWTNGDQTLRVCLDCVIYTFHKRSEEDDSL